MSRPAKAMSMESAIYAALRSEADASGLRGEALAEMALCGREHMSAFRNKRKKLGLVHLCAMADAFGGEIVFRKKGE